MDYFSRWGSAELAKTAVWTMQALYAEDQLRQRTAWALSQIFVLAVVGGSFEGRTEMWLNYYDIFIRNAFGTYRDILREVRVQRQDRHVLNPVYIQPFLVCIAWLELHVQ